MFRLGKFSTGGFDKRGEILPVVHFFDTEIGFGTLVGRAPNLCFQHFATGFGGFNIESVVADESEDFAVAVDGVVAKHFADGDLSSSGTLVGNVLDKIGIACHVGSCCV